MEIYLFRFKVEVYFNPPFGCVDEWHGYEVHFENMWASNAEVAARAIKRMIMKKVGQAKPRLSYLSISEPVLVSDR